MSTLSGTYLNLSRRCLIILFAVFGDVRLALSMAWCGIVEALPDAR
jgi:hypothetical protein